jgi:FKBP-type peptidyl-prolyl cis-trans isomerase 2
MAIKDGDKVKIHYKGTLDDGTVFDSSEGRDPLEFEVGSKQVIPGFEKAVKGMKKGDKKTFKIDCKDAYGEPNPAMVQSIPRDKLPADQEPKEGMMVGIGLPNGQQMPAKITKVTDKEVTMDLNHPLAGKNLTFEIELVSVN